MWRCTERLGRRGIKERNHPLLNNLTHKASCYSAKRKAQTKVFSGLAAAAVTFETSTLTGRLNGRAICVGIHLVCTFVWQRMRIMSVCVCVCVRVPKQTDTHTHSPSSATQPSMSHPCPWPGPCTWLIPLYALKSISERSGKGRGYKQEPSSARLSSSDRFVDSRPVSL